MMPQRESLESKDNTPACRAYKKNKIVRSYEQSCASANQFAKSIWQSVTYERPQRLPDIVPDDQISNVILLGGLVVDDHQSGTAVFGQHGEPGGRPDHERRPDRHEQVALLRELGGTVHGVFRHRLPERDGGGLYRLVADSAGPRAA